MKRNYGSAGRVDLAAIEPSPAQAFVEGKGHALLGFLAIGVILLGCGAAALYLFELGGHMAMAALIKGGR